MGPFESLTKPPDPLSERSPFFLPWGNSPPVGQGLLNIEDSRSYSDTPHSVGLLWTSDQPDVETSTWQLTTFTTDIHAPGGIRTQNPSNRAAADLRLRPRGHWDRPDRCIWMHDMQIARFAEVSKHLRVQRTQITWLFTFIIEWKYTFYLEVSENMLLCSSYPSSWTPPTRSLWQVNPYPTNVENRVSS